VVEKLIYVVWKRAEDSVERFREDMLGHVARELSDLGLRGLSMNLADEAAAYAQGLRITRMETPLSGTVTLWLDTALARAPYERILAAACRRLAGYLVLESVPLVNTTQLAPLGARTPGITTVAFLEKPDRMSYEDWLERWQEHHTKVAIETQSTYLYIQNVVVRTLTKDALPWSAIVEEGFPADAATDPMVFYAAGGSREKLEEHQQRMVDSCRTFIDFSRLESHPMSSYVLEDWTTRASKA
jgi:hypothetical protein